MTYTLWEEWCRTHYFHYPLVVWLRQVPFDMTQVYPLQQCKIERVYYAIKDNKRVVSVRLFGSSISQKCTDESDIDLFIKLDVENDWKLRSEITAIIKQATDWSSDIIWADRVSTHDSILPKWKGDHLH